MKTIHHATFLLATTAAGGALALSPLALKADNAPAPAPPKAAAASTNGPAPRIVFTTNIYNFGTVKQGEVVKHEFTFTNTGTAVLEITEVKPGCGCTTAGAWDKSVEPGKTGQIPLQFNSSGFGGSVAKSATVTCNDPATPTLTLMLQGTVWKPIEITPNMAMFNFPVEDQTNQVKSLRIVSNLEEAVEFSELKSSNPAFVPELKTVKEGKEFSLEVTAVPPFTNGTIFANITMKTSSPKVPSLNVSVYATTPPLVYVMPQQVAVPHGPLTNSFTTTVTLRNNSAKPFVVSEPALDIPGTEVKLQEVQAGRQVNVVLTFPAGLDFKQDQRPELVLKCDLAKMPLIKVPVLQTQVAQPPINAKPPVKVSSTSRVVPTRVPAPAATTQQ